MPCYYLTCITVYTYTGFLHIKIIVCPITRVRTVTLTKIKNEYVLIVPEAIAKLYDFKKGQMFNLEIKESDNVHKLVFLTYATTVE